MKKNYTVKVLGYATVLVEGAESEDEAIKVACDQVNKVHAEEWEIGQEVLPADLDSRRRHSEFKIKL